MVDTFYDKLKRGQRGEDAVCRWLVNKGYKVLPAYEVAGGEFKGPRLFGLDQEIASPDFFVFPNQFWVEVKLKKAPTWHRNSQQWLTSIDGHYFAEYQKIQKVTGCAVNIIFIHTESEPYDCEVKDAPPECETGMYAANIDHLAKNIHHPTDRRGKGGMVYWNLNILDKLAELDELL